MRSVGHRSRTGKSILSLFKGLHHLNDEGDCHRDYSRNHVIYGMNHAPLAKQDLEECD